MDDQQSPAPACPPAPRRRRLLNAFPDCAEIPNDSKLSVRDEIKLREVIPMVALAALTAMWIWTLGYALIWLFGSV